MRGKHLQRAVGLYPLSDGFIISLTHFLVFHNLLFNSDIDAIPAIFAVKGIRERNRVF